MASNCRCSIRYVGKPQSKAAKVLPTAGDPPVTDPADPIKDWLTGNVPKWKEVAKAAGPRGDVAAATREARRLGIPMPSEIANMVIRAMIKPKEPPAGPAIDHVVAS